MTKLHLIGYASGLAGVDIRCQEGPLHVQRQLRNQDLFHWESMIYPSKSEEKIIQALHQISIELAHCVSQLIHIKKPFCVIGGDHTCAMGTWSGVSHALHKEGDLGLIWIDAHMDSHTPETSHTGRYHGMSLATLLGYGDRCLTNIFNYSPKIKPENVCLIGTRSYENEEAEFLEKHKIKIYYMDEVQQRGLSAVIDEAIERVTQHTAAFGVSIDLDAIDPEEAPGVDVAETNGIHVCDLRVVLQKLVKNKKLIATEIAEFNPSKDKDSKTEKIIIEFLTILAKPQGKL
jgi:arginase